MTSFSVHPIGWVRHRDGAAFIQMDREYAPGLKGLDGFGHIQVLWWFSQLDDVGSRSVVEVGQPYRGAPPAMGVFATRSPMRPNPIALTSAQVLRIDSARGLIHLAYLDAFEGTPVIDIKPYTPSIDRVERPTVPAFCAHWPGSVEQSSDFDWEAQFNF